MPEVPTPLKALGLVVLTNAGCKEDSPTREPLVPAACLQEWQDGGYAQTDVLHLTAASPDLLPPELIGAQRDALSLVGFDSTYLASSDEQAVSPDSINAQVASGELVVLGFEGNNAHYVNDDRVWQGAIAAPSQAEAALNGQVDVSLDLSAGRAEDPNSGWTWEGTFGTDPVTVSQVFLKEDCGAAVPNLSGDSLSTYTVSAEGVEEIQ